LTRPRDSEGVFSNAMPEPLIVLKNLSKRFGKRRAVSRISMSIQAGEIFGFLGANGAGKTTTIRMLCGLTNPSAGSGKINGLDIWKRRPLSEDSLTESRLKVG